LINYNFNREGITMGERSNTLRRVVGVGAALAIVLAACGSDAESDSASTNNSPTTASSIDTTESASNTDVAADYTQYLGSPSPEQCAGGTYDFGFDIFSDSQSFALATVQGVEDAAAKMGCVTIETLSDGADPLKAVENVNIFMQKKKDGVLLAQVIEAAQAGIVDILDRNGVPGVASYVPAPNIPFIDVDNGAAGAKAGRALGEAMQGQYPDEVPYLIIGQFEEGGPLSVERMEGYEVGMREVFPDIPDDHIIYVPTVADPPTANTNTANILVSIPDGAKIAVGGINDETTLGMVEALRTAGRIDDTIAIGQGASVLDAICDGTMLGSIGYFPENYGNYTVPALVAMAQGITLPDFIELPTELITSANLGEFYPESACS